MPPNGCLRVLDPARSDEITYARQSRFLVDAIPLSDLSNILVENDQTAKITFLSEPEHTWCYYFAKAELARQQGNWNQVMDLMDEARSSGHGPEDPFEWFTYIEAQAVAGNIQAAEKLSKDVFQQDHGTRKGLCELWKRVQDQAGRQEETLINQILSGFDCTQSKETSNQRNKI
jgi:hypothetical protein